MRIDLIGPPTRRLTRTKKHRLQNDLPNNAPFIRPLHFDDLSQTRYGVRVYLI